MLVKAYSQQTTPISQVFWGQQLNQHDSNVWGSFTDLHVTETAILGMLHLEEQLAEFHAQRQRELEVSPPICGKKNIQFHLTKQRPTTRWWFLNFFLFSPRKLGK